MTDLLSEVEYGRILGSFTAVAEDFGDTVAPDAIPLTGRVTFVPSKSNISYINSEGETASLYVAPVNAVISQGRLVGKDGKDGVVLLASDSNNVSASVLWNARISLDPIHSGDEAPEVHDFLIEVRRGEVASLIDVIKENSRVHNIALFHDAIAEAAAKFWERVEAGEFRGNQGPPGPPGVGIGVAGPAGRAGKSGRDGAPGVGGNLIPDGTLEEPGFLVIGDMQETSDAVMGDKAVTLSNATSRKIFIEPEKSYVGTVYVKSAEAATVSISQRVFGAEGDIDRVIENSYDVPADTWRKLTFLLDTNVGDQSMEIITQADGRTITVDQYTLSDNSVVKGLQKELTAAKDLLEGRLAQLDTELAEVDSERQRLATSLNDLATVLEDGNVDLTELNEDMANLKEDLANEQIAREAADEAAQQVMAQLDANLSDAKTTLDQHKATMDALDLTLEESQTVINDSKAKIEELETQTLPNLKGLLEDADAAAQAELETLTGRLDQSDSDLATARDDIDTLRDVTLPAVRDELAGADAAAQETLAELDARIATMPTEEALAAVRTELGDARGVADAAKSAAEEANIAANAASQAALEAAGIASSKGRIIVQETEPQGEDRTASNIWIKPIPDDPTTDIEEKAITYVYLTETDEWSPTTSSELAQAAQNALDARDAAQQAQQRADTAIANAAAAQSAAEDAQRTANQATLNARDAHNEAVTAAEKAEAAERNAENKVLNGSFERDTGWFPLTDITDEMARTGIRSWKSVGGGSIVAEDSTATVSPGQIWRFSMYFRTVGGDGGSINGGLRLQQSTDGVTFTGGLALWNVGTDRSPDGWTLASVDAVIPDGVTAIRPRIAFSFPESSGTVYVDDVALRDVTQVVALEKAAADAQKRADEAMAEASVAKGMAEDAVREVGDTVRDTVIEYAVGTSETSAPTSGWSTSTPTRTPGSFVWMRTIVTYADGDTSTTNPALLTGNTGAKGDQGARGSDGVAGKDGLGLKTTTLSYALSTSGTTAPTSGWTATVPTPIKGRYLWTRTIWTYTDNTSETGYSVAYLATDGAKGSDGIAGKDGVGISSTAITYAASSSGTTAPTSGWTANPPAAQAGQFVWTKTVWTYTDSTTETGYSVGKIGDTGPQGSQGIQGPKGADGSSLYTWLKYADTPTTGMSDLPTGKKYMGIAYNKTSSTESSTYSDYEWSLIEGPQGNQGIQGPAGPTGQTTYTWIKYGTSAAGAGMSDSPTGKTYIGIAYNKTTATESTTASDYEWSLIQGPQGPQGNTGATGVSVTAVTPFFRAVARTAAAPAQPTGTAPSGWTTTEPAWNSANKLYRAERITYSNGTTAWTTVSLVATYEGIVSVNASVNGKNSITRSTSNASGSGVVAGDQWVKVDAAGDAIAQWFWDGSAWKPALIKNDMLESMDVHKLQVTGTATIKDAVIDKLWADGIAAKTITSTKISVSSGNIVENADFSVSNGLGSYWSSDSGMNGGPSVLVPASTGQIGTYDTITGVASRTRVVAGRSYKYGVWVRTSGTFSGTNGVALYLTFYDGAGSSIVRARMVASLNSATSGEWTFMEGAFLTPEGATNVALGYFTNSTYTGAARFSEPSVIPMTGAVLIEDGAVNAGKINAESVGAAVGEFVDVKASKIVADSAAVKSAVIDKLWADGIAAKSVTASKLTISPGNLIPEADSFGVPEAELDVWKAFGRDAAQEAIFLTGSVTHVVPVGIKVRAGDRFRLTMDVKADTPDCTLYVRMWNSAGTVVVTDLVSNRTAVASMGDVFRSAPSPVNEWNSYEATFTIPVDTTLHFRFYANWGSGPTPTTMIRNMRMQRTVGAVLIEDGAVNASKINAESVGAAVGEFVKVDVKNLTASAANIDSLVAQKIAAGTAAFQTVNADKIIASTGTMDSATINQIWADGIAAKTITTNKLTVATGNLVPDGDEMVTDVQWGGMIRSTTDKPGQTIASRTQIAGTGGGASIGNEAFPVTPGQEYSVQMWIKASKPDSRFYMELRDATTGSHAGTGTLIEPEAKSTSQYVLFNNQLVPDVWTLFRGTWVPNPDVSSVRFGTFYFNHSGGTERNADISIAGLTIKPKVGAVLIENGSISANHMTANSIDTEHLRANAVSAEKILAGAVTTDKMVANSINGDRITANTLDAGKITSRTITATQIKAGTISANEIASRTITAGKITSGTITANEIKARTITAAEIAVGTITAENISAETITADEIMARTITAAEIAIGTITAENISAETITANELQAESITSEKISAQALTVIGQTVVRDINVQGKLIGTNGVFTGTVDFANVNVSGTQIVNKLGANSISADKISGGSFSGNHFSGGTFEGSSFVGGSYATSTHPGSQGGVMIDPTNGLRTWAAGGKLTVQIHPDSGQIMLSDYLKAVNSTGRGVMLIPTTSTGGGGLWFSHTGGGGGSDAAIYRSGYDPDGVEPLNIRGANGGHVAITGGLEVNNGGILALGGTSNFRDMIHTNPPTTSAGANTLIATSPAGRFYKSTSSRRYKKNIVDWNPTAEQVLALQPRQWQHDDPNQPEEIDETWHVGFVAEEVHDLGLGRLVKYMGDGKGGWIPDGLNYDRFAAAQQVVLRDHEARIKSLENTIESLTEEIKNLRSSM